MQKGDLRKQQILETAEELFCKNGYESTGVQEILNRLDLSKGSFYHHYESKDRVLEQICQKHAVQMLAECVLPEEASVLEKLNLVLSAAMPLRQQGLTFLKMLLPVFNLPEGRTVKLCFQQELKHCFQPLLTSCMEGTNQAELTLIAHPEKVSGIVLDLLNSLWATICQLILENQTDLSEIMDQITLYRTALENLLLAPYGSLILLNMPELKQLCEQLKTEGGSA